MLRHRLTLGPLLIAALLALAWLDQFIDGSAVPEGMRALLGGRATFPPGMVILPVMALAAGMGARELARMLREKSIAAGTAITCLAALTGLAAMAFVPTGFDGTPAIGVVGAAAAAMLVVSLRYYSRNRSPEGVVAAAGGTLLSFVYLGLMFGFCLSVRREHSVWVLIWVVVTTKCCDIGAFATGKLIGRHKLILWLSPGKTWEGLIGGVVASAIAGAGGMALLSGLDHETLPSWQHGLLIGAVFGLVGQAGDLLVSLFKRDAGRKDSGHSLPGFGGVLDVLDSAILVAPVAYWLLRLF